MARPVRLVRAIVLAGCLLVGLSPGAAGDPLIERDAQAIFHRVMSPYCPGLMLAACPSSLAEALRNDIRAELKAGKRPAAIEEGLHRRFGDETRAAPAFKGLGRIVWTLPLLLLAGSGWALAAWLRRCRGPVADERVGPVDAGAASIGMASVGTSPTGTGPARGGDITTELNERLDDELAAM